MSPEKSLFIPKSTQGTRWVIADIHGCVKTFRHLVEEVIQLSKPDQLFLLGDYIDKGPDSGAVIDLIIELQKNDYQIFTLRGNHEDLLLKSYKEYTPQFFRAYLRIQKCKGVLGEDQLIRAHYLEFMRNLPYYFELDDFLLVHAGFDFSRENPFEDFQSMLWSSTIETESEFLNGKKIIHGHTATPLSQISKAISSKASVIPLDNGCVHHRGKSRFPERFRDMGNLVALNLDTWELRVTPNIDQLPN